MSDDSPPNDHTRVEVTDSPSDRIDEEGLTEEQVLISKILRGLRMASTATAEGTVKTTYKPLGDFDDKPIGAPSFIHKNYRECGFYHFESPPSLRGSFLGSFMKKEKVVKMKDYAPNVFADIRTMCGVAQSDYLAGWDFEKSEIPLPKLGAGRSGSLFITAKNKHFVFKTIPVFEVQTLLEILPYLHQYYSENPNSRIIRFLGLHRFHTHTNEKIYAIVMNNLLYHPKWGIDVKYDLKGRLPKPGKEKRFNDQLPSEELKKRVIKDNDLNRKFYLLDRDEIVAQLCKDVDFLQKHNCMDYSLLVGVHWLREDEKNVQTVTKIKAPLSTSALLASRRKKKSKKVKTHANSTHLQVGGRERSATDAVPMRSTKSAEGFESEKKKTKKRSTSKSPAAKKKKKSEEKSEGSSLGAGAEKVTSPVAMDRKKEKKGKKSSHEGFVCMQEIFSDEKHSEIYFIGIIDPLSRYNVKKKVAHLLKSAVWTDDALSTVPAGFYAERYTKYLHHIFPAAEVEENGEEKKGKHKEKKGKGKVKDEEIGSGDDKMTLKVTDSDGEVEVVAVTAGRKKKEKRMPASARPSTRKSHNS